MKTIFKIIIYRIFPVVFCCSLLVACSNDREKRQTEQVKQSTENGFDWLTGKWKRINEKEETKTFENWIKVNDSLYTGHGFVMAGSDTVWQEVMEFRGNASDWQMEVQTPGNDDLVIFTMTSRDDSSFVIENPEHDFPKKIKYVSKGEKLEAVISDDTTDVLFEFERIK